MTSVARSFVLGASLFAILTSVTVARGPNSRPAKIADESTAPAVADSVQFKLAPKHEKLLAGGRFEGSNVSRTEGFQVLAQVDGEQPVGKWVTVRFKNKTPYRWLRFECPGVVYGEALQFHFYSGSRKLDGRHFQDAAEGHFMGVDLGDQASTKPVSFSPGPGVFGAPREIALKCGTAGATIRFTLDGTTPGASGGTLYKKPIKVSGLTTIAAVAFKEGVAPSPVSDATYFVGTPPRPMNSFHVGNSLTGNALQFSHFARTAGVENRPASFLLGGAYTVRLWNTKEYQKELFTPHYAKAVFPFAHFTLQPRDFDIDEEVQYEQKFIDFVREKSPDVQPWLYAEWVERERQRPSDLGLVPTYQMSQLFPAATWEESMSAMLLYVEEVQHRLNAGHKEGKPARILPCSLALGWARNLIDGNQFPGVGPGEGNFYRTFFEDGVHVNPNGCYLVDAVWYAAFVRESPEGKLLPVGTTLTSQQARVIERLAWEIVQNYPDCGLYREGDVAAAPPQFFPTPGTTRGLTSIHLNSTTPGVWYRYTLDGTIPTRTRGYVYCGTITSQPGMTIKAVAYKSGLADSSVAEAHY